MADASSQAGAAPLGDHGMIDLETLRVAIADGRIETVLTVVPDLYGRLMGKRIVGRYFLDEIVSGGWHACDYLLACDMEMEPVPGYAWTSWQSGYGDMRAVPDFSTLRVADWMDRTAIVVCDLLAEEEDVPVPVAPRQILQHQVDLARSMGFEPFCASELEFFLFKQGFDEAQATDYRGLTTSRAYNEDYHVLSGSFSEHVIGAIRRHADA